MLETGDDGRRGGGSGGIRRGRFEPGLRPRFLLNRRLLVNGEELAFLAQADTVFAAALGIIGSDETSDLATAAVDYIVSKDTCMYGRKKKKKDLPHATEVRW